MKIIPAIDLMNNQCVRLTQGDFSTQKIYKIDPLQVAKAYEQSGAKALHIVDLDGAKAGCPQQLNTLKSILNSTKLNIQFGGGIRSQSIIEDLLSMKVGKIILGSIAVTHPLLVFNWLEKFSPEQFCLALDVSIENNVPIIKTHGWQQSSSKNFWSVLDMYQKANLKYILCTDIGRDGMLSEPNFPLYEEIIKRFPRLKLQASGGVSSLEDLKKLNELWVDSVVIGKALYEECFSLEEALLCEITN